MLDSEEPLKHLEHLNRGHSEGVVVIAGPWSDSMFAAFALLRGDPHAAARFVESDPAVRANVLSPTIRAWTAMVGSTRLRES